jgi:hypothetical protein
MKTEIALLALMIAAALMSVAAGAGNGDWTRREEDGWLIHEWVNPHRVVTTWNVSVELFPMNYTAEEDGGYTFAVYFRRSPKVLWVGHFEDFNEEHVRFARRAVEEWNASIRFAVEHYKWAKHLSKLRIKLYTDENITQAPRVNVLINANAKCPGAAACTYYMGDPIIINGDLGVLVHELGHALGLGHDSHGPRAYYFPVDDRGFYIFDYPDPSDNFLLYALATRWRALENSTAGSRLTHPGGILRYRDVAHIVGPLRSAPGYVTVYVYSVLAEGDVERPYPHPLPFIKKSRLGIGGIALRYLYGEDACLKQFSNNQLPFYQLFGNNTALVLYEADVQLASRDRFIRMTPPSFLNPYPGSVDYVVPLKFLTHELLREFRNRNQGREVFIWAIGGAGPATGNFSKIYGRGGDLCLANLKDKVLVEARLGRAYTVTVKGLGPVEPVPLRGWSYKDYNGTFWVLRGSKVYFKPLNETISVGGGVRYAWRGENITVEVYSPISGGELFHRMWKKQYLIEVDSPYPFKGVGWFDEGDKTHITPAEEVIDFNNGTKIVFTGFEGHNGTEITVDRPIKLNPIWKRMYRVDTVSRYIFSEEGKYFDEGESMFLVMDRAKDFGNGTRVELANITAYGPSGEVVKSWDDKSGGDRYALLAYVVDRPLKLVVEWKVYHRLTVSSPINSYEKWVLNGTTHKLDLPERKLVDSDTLMVLKQVRVNSEPQQGLEVTVTSPTSVEAIYQRKLRTTFMVDAGRGHLAEPEEVVLERGGEVEVYRPPFTYIGEGRWRVTKVTYLGGDIAVDTNVEVNVAGMKIIPSRLRAVEVTVVDLLGVPVPYAMVRTGNAGDVTGILGSTTLYAVPPWEFEIMVSHTLGTGQGVIRPQDTEVRIQAGISPYTLVILVLSASLAATVGVLKWRKRQ